MAVTLPYYEFREVLSGPRRRRGALPHAGRPARQVGRPRSAAPSPTRSCCAPSRTRPRAVSYDDDVHPYSDLVIGRVDAVLLDNVLAERRRQKAMQRLHHPAADGRDRPLRRRPGAGECAAARPHQRDPAAAPCATARSSASSGSGASGTTISRSLHARAARRRTHPAGRRPRHVGQRRDRVALGSRQPLPAVAAARVGRDDRAVVPVDGAGRRCIGVLIATGRVYGGRLAQLALTGYVELIRGTPILLQLFVLYYGLAAAVRLPAFAAALLGLALNYAAYESEIYRSALEAIPTGQLEAARTLGLSERQVLRLVRGPQAFRLALAPMTNDFVALLKDSSLVSVLTVLELTKQTQIFATNLGSWVLPGTLCAGVVSGDVAAAGRGWRGGSNGNGERLAEHRPAGDGSAPASRCASGAHRRQPRRRARRAGRDHGSVRLGQDDDPPRGRRPRIDFTPGGLSVDGVALDRRRRHPAKATLRELRRKVGMVFQFHCLFEHLSAIDNVCLAPVHAHGVSRAGCAAARARAARRVRRRASRGGAAAPALGRRGAARRDCARAGGRSAAAADGRTDGVARSRAARGARRAAAGAAAAAPDAVIATHDEDFAREWATRVVRMRDGRVNGTG